MNSETTAGELGGERMNNEAGGVAGRLCVIWKSWMAGTHIWPMKLVKSTDIIVRFR